MGSQFVQDRASGFFNEMVLGGEKSIALKHLLELSDEQWGTLLKFLPDFLDIWGVDKIRAVTDPLLPNFTEMKSDDVVHDGCYVSDLLKVINDEIEKDPELKAEVTARKTIMVKISGDGFSDKNALRKNKKSCTNINITLATLPEENDRQLSTRFSSRTFCFPITIMMENEGYEKIKRGLFLFVHTISKTQHSKIFVAWQERYDEMK